MPVKFKNKVFKSGGSLRVTIPKPIAETLEIEEGSTLEIWVNDKQIVIEKTK